MNIKKLVLLFQVVFIVMFTQGMALVGVKQLSRNNLNEETIATIKLCETTKEEIVDLFREPTDDFQRKQGEYTIYIYKGFSGRGGLKTQMLEVMLNSGDIVVDKRFNHEGDELMIDACK